MSIDISPEAEAKVREIPDFSERLERFIDDQFELEQWRKRHRRSEAAAVVAEAQREGANLRAAEKERGELFARFRALTERMSNGQ